MKNIIDELTKWIDLNIENIKFIRDVVSKSGCSTWYLQFSFKRIKGITLGAYLRKVRLKNAAKDLCNDRKIINTAIKYNLNCQQTFTKAFKKEFNKTPGEYRRVSGLSHCG